MGYFHAVAGSMLFMKDNFSQQAVAYAQFRPQYPEALVQTLLAHTNRLNQALDCGTGNGQLALQLAPYFQTIVATDISDAQLRNATPHPKITYQQSPAETLAFPDQQFDLITVAQALHWFDFDAFYPEVYRTLRDDGLFAAIGYALFCVDPAIDGILHQLYTDILGPYWDEERRYVDHYYRDIPFPFDEIKTTRMYQHYEWTLPMLLGYLGTWSAVQHYRAQTGQDPIRLIEAPLRNSWGSAVTRTVSFPILLRIGRKKKSGLPPRF